MENDAQNSQQTQPAAAPQPQPDLGAPAAAQPAPAAPPAPEKPKSIILKFEEDLTFEITPDVVDDMRFMDLYAEVSDDQLKIPKLMRFLLTDAGYDSIFKYYEDKGQKFRITKFGEVFEKLDKELNSNPDFLRI